MRSAYVRARTRDPDRYLPENEYRNNFLLLNIY